MAKTMERYMKRRHGRARSDVPAKDRLVPSASGHVQLFLCHDADNSLELAKIIIIPNYVIDATLDIFPTTRNLY